jgi:hypothetical protein
MPDEQAFTFSFELPESVPTAEQDEAKVVVGRLRARLARKDQLLVEIEGRYHHPRRQDDATGKGSGSDEEESGHPILSIMVCPGKRPYAPKK